MYFNIVDIKLYQNKKERLNPQKIKEKERIEETCLKVLLRPFYHFHPWEQNRY